MTDATTPGETRGGADLPTDWDATYVATPPWDIGRPQQPFVDLAEQGAVRGRVLDIGCGTGEHALLAAAQGCDALGVDVSQRAIDRARAKADERGLDARFLVHDALDVAALGETFDTVLDCGLLHVLGDRDRVRLAAAVRAVLAPGGSLHLLCFSDRVPGDSGPRRLSRTDLYDTFSEGLAVASIDEAWIEATITPEPVPAWLAHVTRLDAA